MVAVSIDLLPLAQGGRWESVAKGFRAEPVDPQQLLGLLVVVAGMVVLLAMLAHAVNNHSGRRYHGPRRLFLSLCRAHRLSISDCWWMWLVARNRRLKDPARLFLDPELLDPTQLPPKFRMQAARFEALKKRLFAWEEPPKQPAGSSAADHQQRDSNQPPLPTPLPPRVPPPRLELPDEWLAGGGEIRAG